MKILILLLVLATSLEANLSVLQIESYARSSGTKVSTQGGDIYFFQISRSDYKRVNESRKFTGRSIKPYSELLNDPFTNRDYASDLLLSIRNELKELTGNDPTSDQILVGWQIGMKQFKKLGYQVENVKDSTLLLRLELFRSIEPKKEEVVTVVSPLPTDGRKPVATRLWPKTDSDHR